MSKRMKLLNLMISKHSDLPFVFEAAKALREYADAIDEANKFTNWDESKTAGRHTPDVFETSNGCKIITIYGSSDEINPT